MGKYFGTDGFRGEVGRVLTADHAYHIGRFLGATCAAQAAAKGGRAQVLIGQDTRRSGDMLAGALAAGLAASGADAQLAGVIPTPAVAYLTAKEGYFAGAMISASHNVYTDNGIKLFDANGEKWNDADTARIEEYLDAPLGERALPHASGCEIGRIGRDHGEDDYLDALRTVIVQMSGKKELPLQGLHVVLDCANGSTAACAPDLFRSLGASVTLLGVRPDGSNINRACGSTHPETLALTVVEQGADAGFAFDGDGDRCIAVDETGQVVDGDRILFVLATHLQRKGALPGDATVATVMSNLGLLRALRERGIRCIQAAVGDRFVYETMQRTGAALGGENTGHIILREYSTSGDGMQTALALLGVMIERGQALSVLHRSVVLLPQVLHSVRIADGQDSAVLLRRNDVRSAVARAQAQLGSSGRVLLRESGTEPVIRVMVEAGSKARCQAIADAICKVLEEK